MLGKGAMRYRSKSLPPVLPIKMTNSEDASEATATGQLLVRWDELLNRVLNHLIIIPKRLIDHESTYLPWSP